MYNRRNFVKLAGAAAFGAVMLNGNINLFGQQKEDFPLPQTIYSDKSSTFNQQMFEPLTDGIFVFKSDDGSQASMKLIEVVTKENSKNYMTRVQTDSFTLIFEMQDKVVLEDKIYEVSNDTLGDFSMFISTVGKSGKRYQAVFNRVYR